MKRGRTELLHCLECKSLIKCSACKTGYQKTYWSKADRNHAQQRKDALLCTECRAKGCTKYDTDLYQCTTCLKQLGVGRFDQKSMDNFKNLERRTLTCKECTAAKTAREKTLHAQLRQSKRICKCQCRFHKERCPLSPCCYGERRWPGSDGHISEDDRLFLDNLRPIPAWWLKAWGRTNPG